MASKLRMKRGPDGGLLPIEVVTPTIGLPVKILPLTYGQSVQYESFGKSLLDWTDEEKVQLLNENILEVDGEVLEPITEDILRDELDAWTVVDLLQSIALYSGFRRLFEAPEEGNAVGGSGEGS